MIAEVASVLLSETLWRLPRTGGHHLLTMRQCSRYLNQIHSAAIADALQVDMMDLLSHMLGLDRGQHICMQVVQ